MAAFCSTSSSLKARHSPGWGVHKEREVIDGREAIRGEARARGQRKAQEQRETEGRGTFKRQRRAEEGQCPGRRADKPAALGQRGGCQEEPLKGSTRPWLFLQRQGKGTEMPPLLGQHTHPLLIIQIQLLMSKDSLGMGEKVFSIHPNPHSSCLCTPYRQQP